MSDFDAKLDAMVAAGKAKFYKRPTFFLTVGLAVVVFILITL